MRPSSRIVSARPSRLFALGCDTCSLGAPVQDFTVTINGVSVPASQVFNDDFLNQATIPAVQRLASGLLSGSAGSAPVLNDDGSVMVKGLVVVPAGGAKLDALQAVLLAPAPFPAGVPVSSSPANVLTQPPAAWWTGVARANTTDAALVRLENDLRNTMAAVLPDGSVVAGGFNPSTGRVAVYVTLQPAGAVNVGLYQGSGGRVFNRTSPTSLVPLAPAATAGAPVATGTDFFSRLFQTTAQQVATIKTNQLLSGLTPPAVPPLPNPLAGGSSAAFGPGGTLPAPSALPAAPVFGGGSTGSLGLGFGLPVPPVAPVAPSASALAYGGGAVPPLSPVNNSVPIGGNVSFPYFIPSTLSTAPQPPALPVFPGIPPTAATGSDGGLSGSGFISGLANAAPVAPVAYAAPATPWLKYGLIAGGVLAAGLFAWKLSSAGGSRPAYRRRRYARA